MTRREYAIAMAALLSHPLLQAGQQPGVPPPPAENQDNNVIRVDVDLVNILFSVRQKHGGALVPNLTKDDFSIFEEGKQQAISRFVRESDLPLTLGLLVDVSASQTNLIEIERQAASAFFSNVLRPKDEAFLISFGKETELLQDLTGSAKLLHAGLRELKGDSTSTMLARSPLPTSNPGAIPQAGKPKGTLLYDAIYLAANEKLKSEVGRKAMVLITDGADMGSYYNRDQAIEAAQRADAMIYSIYYVDSYFYNMYGGGGGDRSGLKKMSQETGGRVFEVSSKHTLDDVFKEIQEEMRNQYAIGYTPTNTARDGSFRRIEIKTKNKDYVVQARKGYYATRNDAA